MNEDPFLGCERLTKHGLIDAVEVVRILFLDNYKTLFYLFLQGFMPGFAKI
ncbi:MAG TPA: hypothetical protein VFG19_07565 [Geobacteraceae bacterium]|nr:hypothetical protein [Geobacteraceae bacterium]